MCVIVALKPNQMIDKSSLKNACHNNWHSFGLVTMVDGKLDIVRVLPKNGEVDSEDVYKLLEKDLKYPRYLHLRHNTAGATTLENTHPFEVYYDEKTGDHVVFMHNGTLYEYKSKKIEKRGESYVSVDDDTGPSDSKNFADEILVPYTASDFGSGLADTKNENYVKLIKKFWPTTSGNRGLIIHSKNGPLFIGDWKDFGEDGDKLKVSNTDYFDKVTRGPENDRRRLREEEEWKNNQAKSALHYAPKCEVQPLRNFKVEKSFDLYDLNDSMKNIMDDWDLWDREHTVSLGYATKKELESLYSDETTCKAVMDWVFTDYAKLYQEFLELEERHKKASNMIAELKKSNSKVKKAA